MTLLGSFDTTVSALDVHSERLKVHAHNVANASTPFYQRKIPVLQVNNQVAFDTVLDRMRDSGSWVEGAATLPMNAPWAGGGVLMPGVAADPTPGARVYQPGHPRADSEGYITMSNVDIMSDMADATLASRIYEANLSVFGITRSMANRALEIGRGQ